MTELLSPIQEANRKANENFIKLTALHQCYSNLAHTFHQILKIKDGDKEHDSLNWKDCNHRACKANYEVLIKLGLS